MSEAENKARGRPFLGIFFRCCRVYARIYKTRDGSAYEGRCPKCLGKVRIKVGAEGTDERFFIAQ